MVIFETKIIRNNCYIEMRKTEEKILGNIKKNTAKTAYYAKDAVIE